MLKDKTEKPQSAKERRDGLQAKARDLERQIADASSIRNDRKAQAEALAAGHEALEPVNLADLQDELRITKDAIAILNEQINRDKTKRDCSECEAAIPQYKKIVAEYIDALEVLRKVATAEQRFRDELASRDVQWQGYINPMTFGSAGPMLGVAALSERIDRFIRDAREHQLA